MAHVTPSDVEINAALLEYLANFSAYIDIHHHLENALKRGRILLAKTRCSSVVGSAKISQASYNSAEMASIGATARVRVDSSANFELVDELASFDNHGSSSANVKSNSDHKVADPIHWFCGVLVPSDLRQSQLDFRRSLRFIADLATRRANILKSGKRLSDLIKARKKAERETPPILLTDEPPNLPKL
ncbi:hypothetical protein Aperf_G00000091390 [Anoplocephala perfoliata]